MLYQLSYLASRSSVAPPRSGRMPAKVAIIGAGLDLGQARRGVDMGPSAIRYAGLEARLAELGIESLDWGNVESAVAEAVPGGDERSRYLPQARGCFRSARSRAC